MPADLPASSGSVRDPHEELRARSRVTVQCEIVGNQIWTVYIRARGPDSIDTIEQSKLLSTGDFGGSVIHVGSSSQTVVVVVELDASTEDAAYQMVIGKMSAALGANWTVERDPG